MSLWWAQFQEKELDMMLFTPCKRTVRQLAVPSLVVLVMLLFAQTVFAQSPTFARTDYPLLGNTHIAADFNADGKQDLAGAGLNAASVMLNNGDGTFRPKVSYPVAGQTQDVAAGDFNSDGRIDLVVTINTLQISLSLLLGNGDGTFNAAINFPNTSGFDSPDVVATDVNNDGKLDVVILHSIACFTAPCIAAETITVMLGDGDATFQTRELAAPQHMHAMAAGDFNRDGMTDLAIGSENTKLHILLGVGDGTFVRQPEMTLIPGGDLFSACNDVDVADFNRDTIQDLVVPLGNGYGNVVLLGNGDGTFRQSFRITENAVSSPLNVAVADFNLDGFEDIARAMGEGTFGLMEIATGNGDGTFQAPLRYLVPPPQSSLGGIFITASDVNGDSKADVALLVGGANASLVVLRNTTGTTPPPTPAAPTLLSPAQDATVTQPVTFDWSDATGAASYTIQIDDSSTFSAPQIVSQNIAVSSFTTSSLPAKRLWWRVRGINSAGVAGPWSVTRRFTAQAPSPGPAALSALTLSPTSVVGGNSAQGTVTLTSAAPSGGAIVTLSSSNTAVATVPASVTIAGGATSATFTIPTQTVTASSSVTISAAYGGVSKTATLTVTAQPPPTTDTVGVQVAEYASGNRELRVEATSSNASATLQVYVTATNTLIGTLRNEGGGRYRGEFSLSSNPQNITVRSSLGGSATKAVTVK
jgi:hypothetical protein